MNGENVLMIRISHVVSKRIELDQENWSGPCKDLENRITQQAGTAAGLGSLPSACGFC